MNIIKLFSVLSDNEKRQLKKLLEDEVSGKRSLTVKEWMDHDSNTVSVRLYNVLRHFDEDKKVSEIDADYFFGFRNAGMRSYKEFMQLRDGILI